MGRGADGLHSYVRLTVGPDEGHGVQVHEMTGRAPIAWRRTPDAVYMVGTAASPVGHDDVTVSVRVLAGGSLTLRSAAASVLWSGTDTRQRVDVTVEAEAELVWAPEPLIATAGCSHRQSVCVELHPTSRLRWRDLLVLGRHGERPGRIESLLRVTVAGAPLLHHVVEAGGVHAGCDGPAVLGSTRVLGQLVVAGAGVQSASSNAGTIGQSGQPDTAATWSVSPLSGPGVLATVTAGGMSAAESALAEAARLIESDCRPRWAGDAWP